MDATRCKRCIMPAGFPGIVFDSEGVCSYCTRDRRNAASNDTQPLGRDKLLEVIRSAKKAGEYDCVVPLSGGKDSVYVLYYAVRELGLRPLAVTYGSGFLTEMALANVRNACDALGVPCVIKEANKNVQDKLLRESLRISETIGSFVRTCMNCSAIIKAVPIKVAKERGIPVVLWGDSARESVRLVKMRSRRETAKYEDIRSNSLMTGVIEKVSKLREVNMTPHKFLRVLPRLVRYRLLSVRQHLSLGIPVRYAIFPDIGSGSPKKGPQIVHFFDYVDWDPVEGVAVLERELGWKHPPDRKSRFDCSLYCFADHAVLQADSISADGVVACNLIREGLLSREEALRAEQLREHTVEEECKRFISEVGLGDFVLPALRNGGQSRDR